MTSATDPSLLTFEEGRPGPCTCSYCSHPRPAAVSSGRIHRAVRRTCIVTTVLAGAGAIGLTLGATTANAMPAPAKQGWDGSKYWFKNASGEWRYTSHQSVYQSRTGSTSPAAPTGNNGNNGNNGIRQGFDGSKYWFKNGSGDWRYTSHYDVYLSRTGQSAGQSPSTPRPPAPPATSSGSTESAVGYALAQLGKPYVWGGNGPYGYDCSGLVQQAFRRSGISLPRVADDQYAATTPISSGRLRRGDLIFWSNTGRASGIHHVAVYLGNNQYVEAPRPGKPVRVATLSSGYYPTHFGRP
ncbi:C40 family peptidase [Kitasatospora sp. McL0602]|uniref:C40 family peptidase n=1 Tax=Kitasatospora sp. McL0602 TaxID=3439530 RepID=UPI003F88AF2C